MGILSDLIPGEIEGLLTADITQATKPNVSFQPFTVTGPSGTITGGPSGTQYSLGGTGQALQSALESQALSRFGTMPTGAGQLGTAGQQQAAQQAFGLGGQFMGQAGMPMAGREQDVYDRIRATQLGEEERQRLQLEERLFN